MRDTVQLPGTDELSGIIKFEAKRDLPIEKIDMHFYLRNFSHDKNFGFSWGNFL